MALKSEWIIVIVALLHFVISSNSYEYDPWVPIEDPNRPFMRNLGEFAVRECNQKNHTNLKFVTIEKGKLLRTRGVFKYKLLIEATDGNNKNISKKYKALVSKWVVTHVVKSEYFEPIVPAKDAPLKTPSLYSNF
ncbi:hypothetical protein ABFS83_08G152400 [Erythranthe nasuta]